MGRFERRWRAASRRHWAILAVSIALVMGGIWIAVGERVTSGVVLLPVPVHLPATDGAVFPAPASETTAAQAQQGQPRIGGPDQLEVCGVGWVKANPDKTIDPKVLERLPRLEAEVRRLLASLASSDDEFERMSALWLEMAASQDNLERATVLGERLARGATTTRDPAVYALAFKACAKTPAASCALLSATRWAQLDVDNGEPWLFLLHEAAVRRDRGQIDDALFHIGAAARVDERFFAIPGALARHVGDTDVDLLASHLLGIVAVGGMAAHASPGFQAVLTACRDAALADANRRERCEAAASALAERSDTLVNASIGAGLGRRLGWPQRRTDVVPALMNANIESLQMRDPDSLQWSCRHAASVLERYSRQAVIGEVRFAREWIEAGGSTVERYVARHAEQRRLRAEDLAGAGSTSVVAAADASASEPAATPYFAIRPPAR